MTSTVDMRNKALFLISTSIEFISSGLNTVTCSYLSELIVIYVYIYIYIYIYIRENPITLRVIHMVEMVEIFYMSV